MPCQADFLKHRAACRTRDTRDLAWSFLIAPPLYGPLGVWEDGLTRFIHKNHLGSRVAQKWLLDVCDLRRKRVFTALRVRMLVL
jgi:hypothetical protein